MTQLDQLNVVNVGSIFLKISFFNKSSSTRERQLITESSIVGQQANGCSKWKASLNKDGDIVKSRKNNINVILKRRRGCCGSRNVTDESQYSIHPDLLTIKKYDTEEEAIANLTVHNNGVSHVGKEFWVAEDNVLNKTLDDSIQYVCDNFKVKVPIGIEWQIGNSWLDCH